MGVHAEPQPMAERVCLALLNLEFVCTRPRFFRNVPNAGLNERNKQTTSRQYSSFTQMPACAFCHLAACQGGLCVRQWAGQPVEGGSVMHQPFVSASTLLESLIFRPFLNRFRISPHHPSQHHRWHFMITDPWGGTRLEYDCLFS